MSDKVSRVPLQIRLRDLDSLGHINNAVHLTYFEIGRVDFMARFVGGYEAGNPGFVIVHSEVDYKKQIFLDSKVVVETKITELGTTSFTFSHRLLDEDQPDKPYATGNTVAVLLDSEGSKMPLPDIFKNLVQRD